jgi:poly(A) polymerase/tRNA nucleotidyltransferase (CCA-adding enzyme)
VSGEPPAERIELPPALARGAPAAVLAALPGARAVGGAVRDALAGLPLHDVDVAAPLPPEAIADRLRAAGLKVFETGLAHGTVTAVLDHEPVEVTSLRRDLVTDGRHAEVAWTTDWREDAARRDFTINAMSVAPDGALFDYFGGRADLSAGLVRFVGDPATRLAEDYLRALRYFRFQARYGRGAPDAAAIAAIRAAAPGLARLSAERVWMELKRLLAAPTPAGAIALMAETGVLGTVLPEAIPPQLDALARVYAAGLPADEVLRLAVLLPEVSAGTGAAIAARLRLSTEERAALVHLHDTLRGHPPLPALAARLPWLSTRGDSATALCEAWLAEARDGASTADLRAWIAATPVPALPVFGRDVVALGVSPGPRIGALLGAVQEWWRTEGCAPDRAACLARLRTLAAHQA